MRMVELRSFEEKNIQSFRGIESGKRLPKRTGSCRRKSIFQLLFSMDKVHWAFCDSQSVRFSVRSVVSVVRKINPRMTLRKHLKNKD